MRVIKCFAVAFMGVTALVGSVAAKNNSSLALMALMAHERVMINWWSMLVGVSALILGALVYVLDRPTWQATILTSHFSLYVPGVSYFGILGNSLPSFLHVVAFAMLDGGLFGHGRRSCLRISLFWTGLNLLFEVAQAPAVRSSLSPLTDSYRGTFDWFDVIAIIAGGTSSYLMLRWTTRKEYCYA
jgi:hypothetical protein